MGILFCAYNNVGYLTHVVDSFGYFSNILPECENHLILSFDHVCAHVFKYNQNKNFRHWPQFLLFESSINAMNFWSFCYTLCGQFAPHQAKRRRERRKLVAACPREERDFGVKKGRRWRDRMKRDLGPPLKMATCPKAAGSCLSTSREEGNSREHLGTAGNKEIDWGTVWERRSTENDPGETREQLGNKPGAGNEPGAAEMGTYRRERGSVTRERPRIEEACWTRTRVWKWTNGCRWMNSQPKDMYLVITYQRW